jgi:sulfur carrier protein ThiS
MKIYLKCFANLATDEICDYRRATPYDLPPGKTVANLLPRAGVAREDVRIAFVNNRIAGMDTILRDGDQVALAPAVGGM